MRPAQSSQSYADFFQAFAKTQHFQVSGPGMDPHMEHALTNTRGYYPSNVNNNAYPGAFVHRNDQGQAPGQPWQTPTVGPDAGRPRLGHRPSTSGLEYVQAIVKNTFVDVVDPNEAPARGLTKSASDSDISRSSEEKIHFWLPSITSSSGASSGAPAEVEDRFDESRDTVPLADLIHPAEPPQHNHTDKTANSESRRWADASDTELPEVPMELPETASVGKVLSEAQGPLPRASIDLQDVPLIVQQIHDETGMPIAELMEAHLSFDLSLVPRHFTTGVLLSIGTLNHKEGSCRPCTFHVMKACLKGPICQFCHCKHRDIRVKRYRLPKKTRDKMKLAAARAEASADVELSSDDEEDAAFPSQSKASPIGRDGASAHRRNADQQAEQTVRHTVSPKPSTKIWL